MEADTGYLLGGLPYIGESTLSEEEKEGLTTPEATAMKVVKPFLNRGYNITSDNWFTSMPLAELLLENKTTLLGTLRSNRRGIPPDAKNLTGCIRNDKRYYKSGKKVIVSYWDKGNKPVLLLSTMHRDCRSTEEGLPEIVQAYETKESLV